MHVGQATEPQWVTWKECNFYKINWFFDTGGCDHATQVSNTHSSKFNQTFQAKHYDQTIFLLLKELNLQLLISLPGWNFHVTCFFLFIDTSIKLQQQILICFGKFSCNSNIYNGFVTTSDVIILFCSLLEDWILSRLGMVK